MFIWASCTGQEAVRWSSRRDTSRCSGLVIISVQSVRAAYKNICTGTEKYLQSSNVVLARTSHIYNFNLEIVCWCPDSLQPPLSDNKHKLGRRLQLGHAATLVIKPNYHHQATNQTSRTMVTSPRSRDYILGSVSSSLSTQGVCVKDPLLCSKHCKFLFGLHCYETDCMVPGVLNKIEVIIFVSSINNKCIKIIFHKHCIALYDIGSRAVILTNVVCVAMHAC